MGAHEKHKCAYVCVWGEKGGCACCALPGTEKHHYDTFSYMQRKQPRPPSFPSSFSPFSTLHEGCHTAYTLWVGQGEALRSNTRTEKKTEKRCKEVYVGRGCSLRQWERASFFFFKTEEEAHTHTHTRIKFKECTQQFETKKRKAQ
jgi:hypothetical protein